jgi:hypothetical protein
VEDKDGMNPVQVRYKRANPSIFRLYNRNNYKNKRFKLNILRRIILIRLPATVLHGTLGLGQ